MADTNMFLFSTVAQVNYFAQVGRLIAEHNYGLSAIPFTKDEKNENVVCIHIPTSYSENADIITCVQRAWRISKERCTSHNIKCVFAILNKVVVGIYEFGKYEKETCVFDSYEKGRRELNLVLAKLDYQTRFLGRRLNIEKMSEQPIRYIHIKNL
jgi:hypothetical protein